jgi:protein gp37
VSEKTGIQWTDHTFNPWWGCVKVSPECDHCYAATLSNRYWYGVWGKDAPRRWFGAEHWRESMKWNAKAERDGVRRRVFCASMADVFEQGSSDLDTQRANLWALIEMTPHLDWLLLTKRPGFISRMVPSAWLKAPRPNVWYGTTVGLPDSLWRVYQLRDTPAAVRFISYEPALAGVQWPLDGIHWLIAGGESGAGNRPPEPAWIQSARDQCLARGVSFFFKQWGGFHPKANGALLDGREWKEFPVPSRDEQDHGDPA